MKLFFELYAIGLCLFFGFIMLLSKNGPAEETLYVDEKGKLITEEEVFNDFLASNR